MVAKHSLKWCYLAWITAIIITVLFTTTGCLFSDYRPFTLERGIGHFSLEYPTVYRVAKVEVREDLGYTHIGIRERYIGEDRFSTFIFIYISESDYGEPNPDASLERALELAKDSRDFKLLDRSLVKVSGIPGEQIVYFYNTPPSSYEESIGIGWKPAITRDVYLAYGKSVWSLSISYQLTTEMADKKYEADFEHILETFQILD